MIVRQDTFKYKSNGIENCFHGKTTKRVVHRKSRLFSAEKKLLYDIILPV
jgi:hypothetical protein